MLQAYLVTEEDTKDTKQLNWNEEVFECLITLLNRAILRKYWHGVLHGVAECTKVVLFHPIMLSWLKFSV